VARYSATFRLSYHRVAGHATEAQVRWLLRLSLQQLSCLHHAQIRLRAPALDFGAAADFVPPSAILLARSLRGPKPLRWERWATMGRRSIALIVTALLPLLARAAPADPVTESARRELNEFRPGIAWHPVLRVDINCDGNTDEVFSGRDAKHYYLAAVVSGANTRKISITAFFLEGDSQDSFCGDPSLVEKESMDYDPTEPVGEVPEGFQRSTKCFGLHLVAGECDTFHLFWNHKANELDWWRL
jgi:hypothetical protein